MSQGLPRNNMIFTFQGEKCAFRHNEKAKMGSQELCPQWDQLGICEDRSCNLLHPKKPTSTSSTAATPTACAITSDIIGADVSSPPLSPTHFVTTIKDIVIPGKVQLKHLHFNHVLIATTFHKRTCSCKAH